MKVKNYVFHMDIAYIGAWERIIAVPTCVRDLHEKSFCAHAPHGAQPAFLVLCLYLYHISRKKAFSKNQFFTVTQTMIVWPIRWLCELFRWLCEIKKWFYFFSFFAALLEKRKREKDAHFCIDWFYNFCLERTIRISNEEFMIISWYEKSWDCDGTRQRTVRFIWFFLIKLDFS